MQIQMMEMNRRYIVYAMMATIVTLSSCAGEESEAEQSPPVPISVTVNSDHQPLTRNDETTPLTSTTLQSTGFGLYCQPKSSTATYSPIMNNQKFTHSGSGWTYSPTKYWPNDNNTKLNFIAYAPYTTDKVSYNSTTSELTYRYTVDTDNPFDNIDLCTAVAADRTSSGGAVPLTFEHQTARLDVQVKVDHADYDENNKLYYKYFIKSVTIETGSKNRETLHVGLTGNPSWVSDANDEDLTYNISSFPEGIGDPDPEIGTVAAFQAATSTLNNTSESRIFPDSKYLTILPPTKTINTISVNYVEYVIHETTAAAGDNPAEYEFTSRTKKSKEITNISLTDSDNIVGGHRYTLNIELDPSSDTTITP